MSAALPALRGTAERAECAEAAARRLSCLIRRFSGFRGFRGCAAGPQAQGCNLRTRPPKKPISRASSIAAPMAGANFVSQFLKGGFTDVLGDEEMVAEALRDLVRDEIKRKMREELEKNPELREEIRNAVRLYFEAKVQEAHATLRFVKASAKLGVSMLPTDMREELGREIGTMIEKEVAALLEKAV